MLHDDQADRLGVPRGRELDGGPLFLPRPEKNGDGALTFLPAPNLTILAWWGSPFDTRGAVNNAIITSGLQSAETCWARFCVAFPLLSAKLKFPTIVRGFI
jgi:hypothetical protein